MRRPPARAPGPRAVGAAVDTFPRAADVAADGGQTAAGVLDERADDHIRADVAGLNGLDKLAVAVVHHAEHVRLALFAKADQLADACDGERRTHGVALAALDRDELCFLIDRGADAVEVEAAVGQQIDLAVGHAVLRQRAGGGADADDLLQRVVGLAYGGEQLVPRQQICAQRDSQRVRAADELRAHEGALGMEGIGVDALERVAAGVIVAVSGGAGEAGGVHAVVLHRQKHLCLVLLGDGVDGVKARAQRREDVLAEGAYARINAEIGINIMHGINDASFLKKHGNAASISQRGARYNCFVT